MNILLGKKYVERFRYYQKAKQKPNKALHPTPKARAFLESAISEQNVAYAKSSLAFGAGEFGRLMKDKK
jgi:hypothetical protein